MAKLSSVLKKSAQSLVSAPTQLLANVAQGDLSGVLKESLKLNVFTAPVANLLAGMKEANAPQDVVPQATLTPPDPNAIAEQQKLEEQKRRKRLPGRSQFVLNRSSYQAPSLIGDNSVLGTNNRLV